MSMFPHTITVYNTWEDPVTFDTENHVTILRGVFYDSAKAVNVRESGLTNADSVNLIIPFDVEARRRAIYPRNNTKPLWISQSTGLLRPLIAFSSKERLCGPG